MGEFTPRLRPAAVAVASALLAGAAVTAALVGGDPELPTYIGTAHQEPDGTLTLFLDAYPEGGGIGHGVVRYPPDDPDFPGVAAHVGPIPEGDRVPVRPWPDD